MPVWEDKSTYSRYDTERKPWLFICKLPRLEINVHHHRDYPNGTWCLTTKPAWFDVYPLGSATLEAAQAEALRLVIERCEAIIRAAKGEE